MQIAHLLGSLNRGGAEISVLDVLKNLKDSEFGIIGIHRKKGALINDFYKSEKRMYKIQPNALFDLFYFIKLRRLIKKENVQILHSHQVLDAILAYVATIGMSVKIVLTFHGYLLGHNFVQRYMRHFIIKRTSLNLFVSNALKEYYLIKYLDIKKEQQQVLYNGISFDKLNIDSNYSLRKELKIDNDTLLLGFVGSFTSVRDHLTICNFVLLLKKEDIPFKFIFIGGKSNAEYWLYDNCYNFCIDNGLSKHVEFLGVRNDVPLILKELDSFVYSTERDTFGIAVVEAMAAAIPVFVNDWEVMLEITKNGKYATVYKTKDEEDLLNKFLDFLSNRDKYKSKAIESSKFVRSKFSIENHISNLTNIYKNILKT